MIDYNIEAYIVSNTEDPDFYRVGDVVRIRTNNDLKEIRGRITQIDYNDKCFTIDCSSEYRSNTRHISLFEIFDICLVRV